MTICKVDISHPGKVEFLVDPETNEKVRLIYEVEKLEVKKERMLLDTEHDPRIKQQWGEYLVRILFTVKDEIKDGKLVFQIYD